MPAIEITQRLGDLFSAPNVAAYYDTRQEDVRPYYGESLFPPARLLGLSLSYIKGRANAPVLLRPSAFDAHAPLRPRLGVEKITHELPFFRESMKIGEKERQDLLMSLRAGDSYVTPILDRIYDDQYQLVLGADAVAEVLRMTLLSTGGIETTINDMPYQYDYGFDPAKQAITLAGPAMWTSPATATPMKDIRTAMKAARLSGARLTMTQDTYDNMLAADEVMKSMFPQTPPSFIPDAQREEYMRTALKVTFHVIGPEENAYKLCVTDTDTLDMFPDGVVSMAPTDGNMGNTYYGTTPEEADLLADSSVNVSVVGNGVAVMTQVEPHPVNLNTYASQIVLPSCPRIDRLYIMNVYAA